MAKQEVTSYQLMEMMRELPTDGTARPHYALGALMAELAYYGSKLSKANQADLIRSIESLKTRLESM